MAPSATARMLSGHGEGWSHRSPLPTADAELLANELVFAAAAGHLAGHPQP